MPDFLPSTPAIGEHVTIADLRRIVARTSQLGVPESAEIRVDVSFADGLDVFGPPGSRVGRVYIELPPEAPIGGDRR